VTKYFGAFCGGGSKYSTETAQMKLGEVKTYKFEVKFKQYFLKN
jgi:hypothetical protein